MCKVMLIVQKKSDTNKNKNKLGQAQFQISFFTV